jgi:bifunctional DNA-binding transcriptional regulator/antitoxin component of YhaV-PrlF toxin-antitoxin module
VKVPRAAGRAQENVTFTDSRPQSSHVIPAAVRRKLGVGSGSVLEWEEDGDRVVVRKAGRFSSEDIHKAIFPKAPRTRTLRELKEAVSPHPPSARAVPASRQALAGVACRRRQRKYESPQSTPVPAAQPHACGPSPTARWAMIAEPRSMAKPA